MNNLTDKEKIVKFLVEKAYHTGITQNATAPIADKFYVPDVLKATEIVDSDDVRYMLKEMQVKGLIFVDRDAISINIGGFDLYENSIKGRIGF